MEPLPSIQAFAAAAHEGQRRKFADEPYMAHPVRVMERCRDYTPRLPVLAAALLHDVLEDTAVTESALYDFLQQVLPPADAQETLQLTIALTDVYTRQAYPKWNRRKRKAMEAERMANVPPDAQTIKYADIIDNSIDIVNDTSGFAQKYLHESRQLLNSMTAGNAGLRKLTADTITRSLATLKS